MKIKKQILKHMAGGLANAQKSLDPRSKKFLAANGGWAVTLNDIVLPLALLYTDQASPIRGDKEALELAMAGGDGLRKAQEPDGQWEFVKIDGSKWGKIYQPWTVYHWCEAYALLRDVLPKKRREAWATGLTLCYDGLARQMQTPRSHNIPTWNGMSLVRGGALFGRDDWTEVGRRQIYFAIEHQHPDGYWPEGDGPTNGYNNVYIHAIGLYHAITGDRKALPPLKRAVTFRTTFAYPDGSAVETVDGRQRYHPGVNAMGWPGLALFAEGQRLIEHGWQHMRKSAPSLSQHLASYVQYGADGDAAPLPQEGARHRVVYRNKALTRRAGPWFYSVSGYAPQPASRLNVANVRWYMSRTNALSVWHDRLGLFIGGGHSKHDPVFCTFEVWKDAAWFQEPTGIRIAQRDGEDRVQLIYGSLACELHLKPQGANKLKLSFVLPAATARRAQVRAHLTMRLKAWDKIRWQATGKPKVNVANTLDPKRAIGVSWSPNDGYRNRKLSGPGWSIDMPNASAFSYPAYPFNPYAIDNAAGEGEALGALSIDFPSGRRQELLLRVD